MSDLYYVPLEEIQRIQKEITNPIQQTNILANIFRFNTLYMIAQAGSGHIGSSFSCMDILAWLWLQEMYSPNDTEDANHDICFSSKGHDAPGLYALLIGLGKLDFDLIHSLRRYPGLPGHPDVSVPYIVTNTGSLGMGIAKARGMAIAKRLNNQSGRIYVITGDGELQEGQNYESLQPTANGEFSNITVIVDHNKMQSDTWVNKVSDLGDLEAKFKAFGWEVARHDGHDMVAFAKTLEHFKTITDRPQILIADTIKGKGVSFMESTAFGENEDLYKFHSGAPSEDNYSLAVAELTKLIDSDLQAAGVSNLQTAKREMIARAVAPAQPQKMVTAYGDELKKIGDEREDIVVMDADLVLDTGLIPFRDAHPERFIECGIAEQDMVSAAGGLALSGKLPIVHSFSCFLSTRPNEQIYNNATELTKIIYTGSLAGLLPAGPGHSHQSVRDISTLGSVPGMTLIEPCNEQEARLAVRWAVEKNMNSTYIRLVSIPCDIPYTLPDNYALEVGKGVELIAGDDIAIIGYGPILLPQAVKAAAMLNEQNISTAVYNLPWLNEVDINWLDELSQKYKTIFTLDNHFVKLGQGVMIAAAVNATKVISFGLSEVPVSGQNSEALEYHQLDASSLARRITEHVNNN